MRPLVPDPNRNAILTCRGSSCGSRAFSTTGDDGVRSKTAVQRGHLCRQSSLDADPGGRNGENHPPATVIPYVKPYRSVCPTPWPALKSP
jgi:hypothetical protein